jgi:copper oxidase (laccase) domain-containing protein
MKSGRIHRSVSRSRRVLSRFFTPTAREGHPFDLPGFIASRVEALDVASFEDLGVDTYADEARCFSYRRSVHRREPDYGRYRHRPSRSI